MCIICIKPGGVALPKDKVIKTMFNNNSNGAGFCYTSSSKTQVTIVKGFFEVDALIKELRKRVTVDATAIIHFRLATHGAVDGGNCHPFPAIKDLDKMRETTAKVECAVAHNGVFSMPEDKMYSDTMLWISSRFSDRTVLKNLHRATIQHLINDSIGTSRLAVMAQGMKHVLMFGSWEHDKASGLYFSNGGYKERKMEYWCYNGKGSDWRRSWKDWNEGDWTSTGSAYGEVCEVCKKWTKDEDLVEQDGMMLCSHCWATLTRDNGGCPKEC